MRIVFMGSPDFALPTLRALIAAKHEIVAVYSQPPRPAGRGHKLTPCPVHAFADEQGIPSLTPLILRSKETEELAALAPDLVVVVAYGLILPQKFLDVPKYGCINLHPSILPRWRGPAPIQRAVMAGDSETAATIMQMDAGCDTGPVLLYQKIPIPEDATSADMSHRLAELGAELMVAAVVGLERGLLKPIPQPAEGKTYARKLSKEESMLDWKRPAKELVHLVRGMNPWPAACFDYKGERIKVLKATALEGNYHRFPPGQVINDPELLPEGGGVAIATGMGLLKLEEVQRPNRSPMAASEFIKAFSMEDGSFVG